MSTPFYDLASLVVVPSGYKASKVYAQKPLTTDGQLAFTRSTTATRVNSAGLIEASAINVPRLDYLNSSCPRLLLEPQRTNLVTYSEQLNTGSGGTTPVTANTAVSPDGYTNADTIGTGYWTKSTSQSAGTYTLSVFAKYQSAATFGLYIYDGAYYQGTFNLQTGVATPASGSPTVSMVSYGNGWYRCTLTATTASTISEVGFGSGNFYGYGLQLEAGAYATSYIPTLGAAVTRGADACSKTGISSLIGQTEGVIFLDFVYNGIQNLYGNLINSEKNVTNSFYIHLGLDGNIRAGVFANSVQRELTASGFVIGQRYKLAFAYKTGESAIYSNGVQKVTSASSFTFNSSLDDIVLNDPTTYFGYQENVSFNQALLFKTRLTNAQLAELTTI